MIGDVLLTPLKVVSDPRGDLRRMLSSMDVHFRGFGEIYFSIVESGCRKGWRRHHRATSQLAVPVGDVHFTLFDDRHLSPTYGDEMHVTLGLSDYRLLSVPPLIWFTFKNVGESAALVANCSSMPHNPEEVDRKEADDPSMPKLG